MITKEITIIKEKGAFKEACFIKLQDFIKNNSKYLKLSICLLIVFCLTIIFYRSSATLNIMVFLKEAKSILTPFIYGIGIAYVLNPGLKFFENKILIKFKFINQRQFLKRCISISTTYILLFSFLIWLISYLLPEIKESIQDMSIKLKDFDITYLETAVKKYIPDFYLKIPQEGFIKFNNTMTSILNNIPNTFNKLVSGTFSFASTVLNVILGIVISTYILFDKENIGFTSKKTMYALFPKNFSKKLILFFKSSNETFEKFFVGKIIDSTIIGILFFIGASIISPPFTVLLSIIIGFTNMIPFFGPFIGGVPVVLITLVADITNPLKALWIALFILALQQFDGNILGPKILGDCIGVKPLGIIFSIVVAGAIFGPAGMFFGVPVFAVIFEIISNYIDKRYKKNMILNQDIERGD